MNFLETEERKKENLREREGKKEREEESNPAPGKKNSFPEENLLEIETSSLLL